MRLLPYWKTVVPSAASSLTIVRPSILRPGAATDLGHTPMSALESMMRQAEWLSTRTTSAPSPPSSRPLKRAEPICLRRPHDAGLPHGRYRPPATPVAHHLKASATRDTAPSGRVANGSPQVVSPLSLRRRTGRPGARRRAHRRRPRPPPLPPTSLRSTLRGRTGFTGGRQCASRRGQGFEFGRAQLRPDPSWLSFRNPATPRHFLRPTSYSVP